MVAITFDLMASLLDRQPEYSGMIVVQGLQSDGLNAVADQDMEPPIVSAVHRSLVLL